jgi:hypothetical protein
MAGENSDLRVVIAGAGGRMGRTLIHAVAAAKGVTLVGAVDAPDSAVIGRDAGELAGLGRNGIEVVSDAAPLLRSADALIEFTIPAATLAFAELTAKAGLVHVIGTTGHSAEEEAVIAKAGDRATIVKSGNMSLGVNLLAALVKRVAKTLNEEYDVEIVEMHHNKKIGARPRRHHRRTLPGRYRLCFTARRHGRRRAFGDFCRAGRARGTHPPRRGSHDFRAWRAARRAVGARQKARPLFDG